MILLNCLSPYQPSAYYASELLQLVQKQKATGGVGKVFQRFSYQTQQAGELETWFRGSEIKISQKARDFLCRCLDIDISNQIMQGRGPLSSS